MTDIVVVKSNEECDLQTNLQEKTVNDANDANDIMCDTVSHLIKVFGQPDDVEIPSKTRLFVANEILPKAYDMYVKFGNENGNKNECSVKYEMRKTVVFIRKRLLKITHRDRYGVERLRKIADLERIWIKDLLKDILQTKTKISDINK